MKIICINGNFAEYDGGLGTILTHLKKFFSEIDVEFAEVNLGVVHPRFFDGEITTSIDKIMEDLRTADGIIFACTAQLFAATALMQCFLEYFESHEYQDILRNKHCMLLSLSNVGGEKSCLQYLSRVIEYFEGYVCTQLGLQTEHVDKLNDEISNIIDRTGEDLYRAVRQNRNYIIPLDFSRGVSAQTSLPVSVPVPQSNPQLIPQSNPQPVPQPNPQPIPQSNPQSKKGAAAEFLSDREEKEVDEISDLFMKKFVLDPTKANDDLYNDLPSITAAPVSKNLPSITGSKNLPIGFSSVLPSIAANQATPRAKTAKQITQNLPHYYQPQLSAGLQAVIQFSITGAETFDSFLHIHSTECAYTEGVANAPDIVIMADTVMWMDILKGKYTAQKAFMIGGIKVRGDFMLLSKFDSLFKPTV